MTKAAVYYCKFNKSLPSKNIASPGKIANLYGDQQPKNFEKDFEGSNSGLAISQQQNSSTSHFDGATLRMPYVS